MNQEVPSTTETTAVLENDAEAEVENGDEDDLMKEDKQNDSKNIISLSNCPLNMKKRETVI